MSMNRIKLVVALSVSITALFALGVHDVTVLTHRSVAAVAAPMAPARLVHYERDSV